MNLYLACVWLSLRLVTVIFAESPPSSNPNRTLDESTDPDHGRIIDPSHAVLKLDCPGCPVYNETWDTNATALIYDLRITNTTSPPSVKLNSGPFFPAGNNLGFTPMTRHIALPIPYSESIDDYLASPSEHESTEMAAIIATEPVPNRYNWNVTRIQCISFGYGTFDNHGMNTSIANLYLLTPKSSQMEIVWWEIENMAVAHSRSRTVPIMPKKLEEKLLHGAQRSGSRNRGLSMTMTLVIVGVVVCAVTGAAAWVSTRYQNGSKRGIYRAIALDEGLLEEEEQDRELGQFRRSMTASCTI
ncbi:MAG: hypothetical protein Q9170_006912 [Blastenia crenularia]